MYLGIHIPSEMSKMTQQFLRRMDPYKGGKYMIL
jgi:hypothetical protein